jgi:ArsR family transcriptional regulator
MHDSTLADLENLFLALSDKTRLRLLALMVDGEVSVGLLVDSLGESQPKISRHLAYLRNAGLVSTRRDGKWIYYGIESPADNAVARVLDATLRSILSDDASSAVPARTTVARGDEYIDHRAEGDWAAQEYTDDWAPAEMEIHLL